MSDFQKPPTRDEYERLMQSDAPLKQVSLTLNFIMKGDRVMIEMTSDVPLDRAQKKKLLKMAYKTLQGKLPSLRVVG